MTERKKKINCLISVDLHKKIEESEYKNVTEATNVALKRLFNENKDAPKPCIYEMEQHKIIEEYKQEINLLRTELTSTKEDMILLLKTELDRANRDKDNLNSLLITELDRANKR